MSDEHIQAWVVDESSKGAIEQGLKRIDVDPAKVRDALRRLSQLLPDADEPDGRFQQWRMQQVTLSVELSAEAGVVLVGATKASVKGAIEVSFTRVEA